MNDMQPGQTKKTSISAQIKSLNPGDSCPLPIRKVNSIRVMAYNIGLENAWRITTSIDRDRQVVIVKRES